MSYLTLLGVIFITFIALLFVQNTLNERATIKTPLIVNGYLDLSQWDFEKNSTLRLDGDWEFYKDQLIDPSLFSTQNIDDISGTKELMAVPANWNKGSYKVNDYARGYGTYHVKIKLNAKLKTYGIKVTSIRSAHEMYVDGDEIGNGGVVSVSKANGVMGNVPYTAYFSVKGEFLNIVIHVSEYNNPIGGIVKPIYFGIEKGISILTLKAVSLDVLTAGSLLMTGIIFLGLYLYRRVNKAMLFFALYCLCFGFFSLIYNERVLLQLIAFPYVLSIACVYISMLLSFSFILLFMNRSSSLFFPDMALKIYLGLFALFAALILVTPYTFYIRFEGVYLLTGLSSYLLILFNLIKALILKNYGEEDRSGTLLLLFSALFITINLLSDIAHNTNLVYDFGSSQLAIFLFVGSASLYLAKKHSDAFFKIEGLVEQLKEVDRNKDEFLVFTAHEFKTPLNGIINITQGIIDSKDSALSNNQRVDLSYIKAIATRLSSLINDIMDFQSIKENKFKLYIRIVDIHGPIQIIVEVLMKIYSDKGIEVITQIPSGTYFVLADENRLRQIFNNLIGNALKFTEQGQVHIRAEEANGQVMIYIEDTGIGIDKERQETIFQPFEYSKSNKVFGHRSTGIGLPLSSKLADQMNGNIRLVESEVGVGSKFCLRLPVAEIGNVTYSQRLRRESDRQAPSDEVVEKTPPKAKSTNAYTILVVDDEAINIEAVKAVMTQKDYNILSAYSGQQALDMLNQINQIDLVLLDVMMPGLSGFETLLQLREKYSAIELPVLIMSVINDTDSISYALSIGANDYLSKPFEASELLARVQNCADLKEAYMQMVSYELLFLQAQIKPHFIFNTLSVIAALAVKEPLKAKEVVLDLADYLRLSFDFENHSGLNTLENELSLVKAYILIEQARFKNRLTVTYDIDADIDCTLPVLCIQPLVENAVRHCLMKNQTGGAIAISAKWIHSSILITIEDNGSGIDLDFVQSLLTDYSSKGHVGIRNIHNRLTKIYGEGLHYENGKISGTIVSFKIPYVLKEEIDEHTHR